jgi:hypothetical protein
MDLCRDGPAMAQTKLHKAGRKAGLWLLCAPQTKNLMSFMLLG